MGCISNCHTKDRSRDRCLVACWSLRPDPSGSVAICCNQTCPSYPLHFPESPPSIAAEHRFAGIGFEDPNTAPTRILPQSDRPD